MPAHREYGVVSRVRRAAQRVPDISANTIFLGCNFGNKRVKRHFNKLKQIWEASLPVRVYLSDQVPGKGARDLWEEISGTIKEANLAIFDVTSFRPNVVLELGVALAIKQLSNIVICRDLTPGGRTIPEQEEWLLTDISHLNRIDYKSFKQLDEQLIKHIDRMSPVKNFYKLMDQAKHQYAPSESAYVIEALEFLKALRDNGPISRRDFRFRLEKRGAEAKKLGDLLVCSNLAIPTQGRRGVWQLVD